MSRIGNKHIVLPAGVTFEQNGNTVTVKGPKGQLEYTYNADLTVEVNGNEVVVTRPTDGKFHRTIHGTTRALLNNMVVGVSNGFEKVLEINGTGYRAQLQGKVLVVNAGYSHTVNLEIPEGLTVTVPNPTEIHVAGCLPFPPGIDKLRSASENLTQRSGFWPPRRCPIREQTDVR